MKTASGLNPEVSTIQEPPRLLFVDNIRIFLTVLVIAHHLMIIYTNSGGWIIHEGRQDDITAALGGWFCAVNQAYFMGLFLFVAAYFVPGAYDRKGPGRFLLDRLVRLGIPLAFYSWLLRPLLIFLGGYHGTSSFWRWYVGAYFQSYGWIGGGPLWFIEVLLLFSILYVIWRMLTKSKRFELVANVQFPSSGKIALFAVLLGAASFIVRLVSPVNATFIPLNLQFANFPQYIALFTLGLIFYRRKWLVSIPGNVGRLWLGIAIALIALYGPMAILGGGAEDPTPFLGGWHWQALAFALWDAFVCLGMCIGLLGLFKNRLNHQGAISRELSRSAYAAYLIHEPVITFPAMLAAGILIHPLIKFVLACVILTPVCFGLGSLLCRLPLFDRVL